MDNSTYRRNALKTLSVKPAKLGLKYVSRNTKLTNIFHSGLGVGLECGEIVTSLASYLIGESQLTPQMKEQSFMEFGDLGYFMTVLAKFTKVKLPSAGKRVLLKGKTRSKAIMEMFALGNEIADICKKNFYGPKMGEKDVATVVGNGDSTPAVKKVPVIDKEATEALYAQREALIIEKLTALIPLYWALVYDIFEVTPTNVFIGNIAKLSKRYPEGFFELSDSEDRDPEEENAAITGATAAAA